MAQMVEDINSTPKPAIGNIRPQDIRSPWDNWKIDRVLRDKPKRTYEGMKQNQLNYENNSKLPQLGSFVYANFMKTSKFDKSYDVQVCTYINKNNNN